MVVCFYFMHRLLFSIIEPQKEYPMKILFVCLGNICRSPMAESVFRKMVSMADLSEKIDIDSAGTGAWHVGEPSNATMVKHANKRDYEMTHLARTVGVKDFEMFDKIIAMDSQNYRDLKSMDVNGKLKSKLFMMTDFCRELNCDVVPDPYYGTAKDFELVIDILEDACMGLLDEIEQEIS